VTDRPTNRFVLLLEEEEGGEEKEEEEVCFGAETQQPLRLLETHKNLILQLHSLTEREREKLRVCLQVRSSAWLVIALEEISKKVVAEVIQMLFKGQQCREDYF
jgi:hypothetical protein